HRIDTLEEAFAVHDVLAATALLARGAERDRLAADRLDDFREPYRGADTRRPQHGALPSLRLDLLERELGLGMHPGADAEQRCRGRVDRFARGLLDIHHPAASSSRRPQK